MAEGGAPADLPAPAVLAHARESRFDWLLRPLGLNSIHSVVLQPLTNIAPDDPVIVRAEDQIHWFDFVAKLAMRRAHRLRFVQIVAAALIPVTQVMWVGFFARLSAAVLGAFIVLMQGLQGMWHDSDHYSLYRSTAEELQRHRFLFSVGAGPYANPPSGKTTRLPLAENVDAIVSR
jgi:hypothetical protein